MTQFMPSRLLSEFTDFLVELSHVNIFLTFSHWSFVGELDKTSSNDKSLLLNLNARVKFEHQALKSEY